MKICIPSTGSDLDSQVDSKFGRCEYFIFVDSDDSNKYETVKNASACAAGGAGVTAAQFVVDKGTKVVLVKSIGPKARAVLEAANVKIITKATGKIKEVIEKYKKTSHSK